MSSLRRVTAAASAVLVLAGCASVKPQTATAPDLAIPIGAPAPPHAALYADCLTEALSARRLDLSADRSTQLLRFTCQGAPAAAFYAALAGWSGPTATEWRRDGRLFRSTARVRRDLFGVDYCSAGEDGADAACVVTLNAGGFLIQP